MTGVRCMTGVWWMLRCMLHGVHSAVLRRVALYCVVCHAVRCMPRIMLYAGRPCRAASNPTECRQCRGSDGMDAQPSEADKPRPHAPPTGVCAALAARPMPATYNLALMRRRQECAQHSAGSTVARMRAVSIASHRIASHRIAWYGKASVVVRLPTAQVERQSKPICCVCAAAHGESRAPLLTCTSASAAERAASSAASVRSTSATNLCSHSLEPSGGLCCEPYHRSEQAACKCAQRQLKAAEAIRQWLLGSGTVWRRARLLRAVIRCARM